MFQVIDAALLEFAHLQHVLHPLANEQLRTAVGRMLVGLGLQEAADRWFGIVSSLTVPATSDASSG